jgi:hypothetical protein
MARRSQVIRINGVLLHYILFITEYRQTFRLINVDIVFYGFKNWKVKWSLLVTTKITRHVTRSALSYKSLTLAFLLCFHSQPTSGWESSVTAETDLRNYQVRLLSNLVKDNSRFKRLICNEFYSSNNGINRTGCY